MAPDDDADDLPLGRPLPPEDRLWRHPSELGAPGDSRDRIVLVERSQVGLMRVLAIAACASLLGAGVAVGVIVTTGVFVRERPGTTAHEIRGNGDEPAANLISVANRVLDSVVHLEATGPKGSVDATAVVFRSDGHLITTADAVDAADHLSVVLPDSRRIDSPDVVVVAKSISSDIAVLKIPVDGLAPAAGSEAPVSRWASTVLVDASPVTTGPTISDGVVTREIAEGPAVAGGSPMYGLIEATTRASTTPFRPGTLLLDDTGTVIGMVTERARPVPTSVTTTRSIGRQSAQVQAGLTAASESNVQHFAIPADHVWDVAAQLADRGQVVQPWVGLPAGEDISTEEAHREKIDGGLRVTLIEDGSPASTELRRNDIIVALESNTNNITGYNAFVTELRRHKVGSYVTLRVLRKGVAENILLAVAGKPER